jgi:hypothetical protein
MSRRGMKTTVPDHATKLKTYKAFGEIVRSFAEGKTDLLVVCGPPGLSKSQTLKHATEGTDALLVKGHVTPLRFYELAYHARNKPIVLDDVNQFMSNKLNQEYVRALTETDQLKKLEYQTSSKAFEALGIRKKFETSSGVCIITNWWEDSPLFAALESRAEFFVLDFSWAEVHREVGKWFWDQEVYDYVGEKIPQLRQPDMRLYMKAWKRKVAGLKYLPWREVIDEHIATGNHQVVREYLADPKYKSDRKRAEDFVENGFAKSIQTFYSLAHEVRRWNEGAVPKIKLTRKNRPVEEPTIPEDEYDNAELEDALED